MSGAAGNLNDRMNRIFWGIAAIFFFFAIITRKPAMAMGISVACSIMGSVSAGDCMDDSTVDEVIRAGKSDIDSTRQNYHDL